MGFYLNKVLLDQFMKNFILFVVLFSTISVGYSLKCYVCASANVNGQKVECEPVEQTCVAGLFINGTSCATITYNVLGNSVTYKGCYFKMKEPEGMLTYGVYPANYKTCYDDLCNGSESFKKNFNVLVVTGVLFIFAQLF